MARRPIVSRHWPRRCQRPWQRHAVGAGSKDARTFEWAWVPLRRLQLNAEERAYYIAFAPRAEATLERLAKVAGQRWAIEVGFELAKQQCGLDEYEVRRWPAWHAISPLRCWPMPASSCCNDGRKRGRHRRADRTDRP
ncbi:transposase [Marichromatium sp. AB32]|uniref:transposase n=1 Tax=Marichromatium sp. AB32 TaxID=2483363 RepID=UPI001CC1F865|nr:transposase [Marichromatium sp. AB32]